MTGCRKGKEYLWFVCVSVCEYACADVCMCTCPLYVLGSLRGIEGNFLVFKNQDRFLINKGRRIFRELKEHQKIQDQILITVNNINNI